MPVRCPGRAVLLAACFLTLFASRGLPAEADNLELRTYSVADLVIPIPPAYCEAGPGAGAEKAARGKEPKATQENQLIQLLVDTVEPRTWAQRGGSGTIEYFPLSLALIINQTPEVHRQISDLFSSLRRLQDTEVALEVRFITLRDDCFERIGIDFSSKPGCGDAPTPQASVKKEESIADKLSMKFLNDAQVRQVMEMVQGDTRANIMQAPKITLLNGQAGTVNITENQFFVTGVDLVRVGEQVAFQPRNEPFQTGLRMTARPAVSSDRRFVQVYLKVDMTSLESSQVPLMPVTLPVETREGKVAVTQFLQQPKLNTLALEKTVAIPDGGTVLFGGLKRVIEARNEYGPPVLSKVPYVNRLFKTVGYGRETENVLILVTPRVIVNEQAEVKVPAPSAIRPCAHWTQAEGQTDVAVATPRDRGPSQRQAKVLAELLKAYDEACTEGRSDEAEKLARAALAVDPTCFRKR
jgi:type II secretory pathway component GspD/PulD (secretin)